MELEQRAVARELYRQSCHGAGAQARWVARDRLEAMLAASGQTFRQFFAEHGFDVSAYFASKPISRPPAEAGEA